jgi:hypothetical protein
MVSSAMKHDVGNAHTTKFNNKKKEKQELTIRMRRAAPFFMQMKTPNQR